MAVQAQYPSNILLLNRNLEEGKNILGNNDCGDGCGGFLEQSHVVFNNNGVGINPRKRGREISATPTTTTTTVANMNSFGVSLQNQHHFQQQQQQQQQQHRKQNHHHQIINLSQLQNHQQQHHHHHHPNIVSTGLRLSFGDQQQQQQQQQQIQQLPSLLSLISEDFSLQLKQQSDELNYFLHAQGEQLRRTLAEKRQRHYRALLVAAEEAAIKRLREKEAEVEKATRRNAELVVQAAQLSAEAQSWQARAQAQEAQAASLQAQIHQASAQQLGKEGLGLGCAGGDVEDTESAYIDPVSERRVNSANCKVCKTRAVSVVLLPCRHLCVCSECDGVVQACPVCFSLRSASVEVFFS